LGNRGWVPPPVVIGVRIVRVMVGISTPVITVAAAAAAAVVVVKGIVVRRATVRWQDTREMALFNCST